MKLNIAYLYSKELNLYGDTGNVEILYQRAKRRNIDAEVFLINSSNTVSSDFFNKVDIVFMGGGPDSGQKEMYQDLVNNKAPYLREYVEQDKVGLFICGSYQLLGNYYKAANGDILDGLGIFDLYTEHFGHNRKRCVGNIVCSLSNSVLNDSNFKKINHFSDKIVGFENHGGQTFLGKDLKPFAEVISGFGNNSDDKTEGAIYKSCFGTYFHGPFLSKNPHFADYLILKSLKLEKLANLDDNIIRKARSALVEKFA